MSGYRATVETETRRLRAFQRRADHISRLILNTDLPWIDIAIRIERLRWEAEAAFPDKLELFDLIYVSRYRRLWTQWRAPAAPGGAAPGGEPPAG